MRTRGIAVLLAMLVLASCGRGTGDPEGAPEPNGPAPVAVGDCLDLGAGSRGLTESMYRTDAVVDCEEPHGAEVVAVEPIPDDLKNRLTDTEEYRSTLVERVAAPSSPRGRELATWVRDTCTDSVAEAAGLDAIELDGERGVDDVTVLPAPLAVAAAFAFPEEGWEDEPRVLCLARFNEPGELNDAPQDQPNAEVEGETLRDYLTPDFPVDLRTCVVALPDDTGVAGPCADPHHSEILFSFVADDVLDDEVLAGLESGSDPAAFAEVDALCTEALAVVLGPDHDAEAVTGFGDLGGGWGEADTESDRFIDCSVSAADASTTDLAGGSLIGTDDAPVEIVPRRAQ